MVGKSSISDQITPIREILTGNDQEKSELLTRLIYNKRKINNRHFYNKLTVDQTVEKLVDPKWLPKIARFRPAEWERATQSAWENARKIIGNAKKPRVFLYPGFSFCNGRVYKLDRKPAIVCSPDFPGTAGKNLKVLIAHEYSHFLRYTVNGVPAEDAPLYSNIFEEGWAVWFSRQLLPGYPLNLLFMSNLHRMIGLNDPKGGYSAWCKDNLKLLAKTASRELSSSDRKAIGRMFQGLRFDGDQTPIRTGYYLGYQLIRMLSRRYSAIELIKLRPTRKRVNGWLSELANHI